MKKLLAFASVLVLPGSLGVAALLAHLGAIVRRGEELRNRTHARIGRDRRSERRRQAGPGDRERLADNTVSVLVNRGDGSFRARRDYGTGRVPSRSRSAT